MMIGPVSLTSLLQASAFAAIGIFFMFVGKLVSNMLTKYDDDKLIRDTGNVAVALRTVGFYTGLVLGMAGALSGSVTTFQRDLTAFAIDGIIVLVTLLVAKASLRFVSLRAVSLSAEAEKGSIAAGLVELGAFISTGLILHGSFSGDGGTIGGALLYAAIGQVALALSVIAYEKFTKFNVAEEIKADNIAAGLALAGRLVALGIILRAALDGPQEIWSEDLPMFGIYFAFGMLLLAIANFIGDLLFLPKMRVDEAIAQRNPAAIVKVVGVQIAVALIVAAVL